MKLLAVSTSAKHPSAAVIINDGGSERSFFRRDESSAPHSVSLCTLVDGALCEAGLCLDEIDAFAVDIGPGSFTGVRIGVSFMNALAYSLNKPLYAVPSLAALRRLAPASAERVVVMLDARNGNGYAAVYEGGRCLLEGCACVQSEIMEEYAQGAALVGDAFDPECECSAALVAAEALLVGGYAAECAVPLYLRPSQAERMRKQ